MKRVKVAPGKFVLISDELAAKAAKLRTMTRADFALLIATEPKNLSGPMAGRKHLHRRRHKTFKPSGD